MDIMDIMDIIIVIISAASGFGAKTVWQAYITRKKELESETWKIRTSELEQRLSKFYWPIYLRLQKDNVIWEKFLERNNDLDIDKKKLAYQIEKDVLLPNHNEILEIIESNIHLAKPDIDFEKKILMYIRHVNVYSAIRSADIRDKDPKDFEEPYPNGFFEDVESHLNSLQSEYDKVITLRRNA